MEGATLEQIRVTTIVYVSSQGPLILIPILRLGRKIRPGLPVIRCSCAAQPT